MQHPEAELLTFENYQPRIIRHILKNKQKNKCVCIHKIIRLIIMKIRWKRKEDLIDTT